MFPDARAVGRGHCRGFYESNFITRSMLDWSEAGGACGFSPAASSISSIVLYLEQAVSAAVERDKRVHNALRTYL